MYQRGGTFFLYINVCNNLYIPNTLNIDLILCAENVKSWIKSWVIYFTFQGYTLPHTLNCICVSQFEFHI